MNVRFALLLTLAVLFASPGRAALINGRSYTAISSWAAANGFKLSARGGETVTYTNRAQTRIVLEKDSHRAQINGVIVALCFPAALEKGVMYVAQFDLDKTLEPLVFPQKARRKAITVCLDPGHGGKDTGNHTGGFFGRNEKTCVLALAQEVSAQLKAAGFNVILTRTKDTFLDLDGRPDIANRRGADLFVSLHYNAVASSKASVSGIETYCITPVGASSSNAGGRGASYGSTPANRVEGQSLQLAYQVQRALTRGLGAPDRGVRRARFAVLRDAQMPAILVEAGYMTHPVEGKKIFDAAYRKQTAAAIVRGIVNYQKLTAPTTTTVVTNKTTSTKNTK
jgi:N-acetylmuramoyl-L-alanine amidase